MPGCTEGSALDFHHIDGDRTNHEFNNLLVLCSNHHRLATRGHVDKKACRLIKKDLASQDSLSSSMNTVTQELSRVLRRELKAAGPKHPPKARASRRERSIFNRKYLFHILKTLTAPPRDIYLSIRLLGELQYKGSTDVIIGAVEELRRKTPKSDRDGFFYNFYLPGVESLKRIGTKKAIQWMARELFEDEEDEVRMFVLFMSIAENEALAHRYSGFRIISRTSSRKGKKEICETVFKIRGQKLKFTVKH
jgi:hypothetical protein